MEMLFAIGSNLALGALLLALMAWLVRPDAVRLAGGDEATAVFGRLQPGHRASATLATDGRAALLDLDGGSAVGYIERRGRRWIARVLAAGELRALHEDAGGVLRIEFRDFGWPAARIALPDALERGRWLARLRSLLADRTGSGDRHAG